MRKTNITKVSLKDVKEMKTRGEIRPSIDAKPGESLGPDFWAKARVVEPKAPQPVLLKLDPEVVAFFKDMGKGHLTRMQNVLKAYVDAQRQS